MKKLMMAVVVVAALAAFADNWSFTYQAEVKNAQGSSPLTGQQNVEIRLWKSATSADSGDLLWGRLYPVYLDANGLFNLEVSDNAGSALTSSPTPPTSSTLESVLTAQSAGALYIGLTVAGQGATEIVPRQRIFAVPFAAKANRSLGLTGASSPVEGVIQFKDGGKISSSGITLTGTDSTVKSERLEVKTIETTGSISTGGGSVSAGNLSFTGTLTKDGSEVLPVPVGGIILWGKTTPPEGGSWSNGKSAHWAICDGNNGTLNLKGKFVVGIDPGDGDYNHVGAGGGAKKVTLSADQMPSHSHHVSKSEGLTRIWVDLAKDQVGIDTPSYDYKYDADKKSDYVKTGATHTLNVDTTNVGGGQDHENRPPFYALYYIMRIN